MSTASAIALRATLTRDEYARLRMLSISEGRSTQDVAGDAIRLYLKSKGKGNREK